jgi:hypothetical protein
MQRTSHARCLAINAVIAAVVLVASTLAATADGIISDIGPQLAADGAGSAVCRISIKGSNAAGISTASIKCAGAPALWMFNKVLNPFKGSFQGIKLDPECAFEFDKIGCLLGICQSTGVVQIQAVIEDVDGVQNILCIGGSTKVHLQSSLIAHNTATAVLIAGTADTHVSMNASRILGNRARSAGLTGAGMLVMNASVDVLNSSIAGNTGYRFGGGLIATLDAQVTLVSSCICDNVLRGGGHMGMGGGVYMTGNASVALSQGSRIANNSVVPGEGGGVFLNGDTRLVVSNGSAVSNNLAVLFVGGGVSARGNARLVVDSNSTIAGNVAQQGMGGGVFLTDSTVFALSGRSSVADNHAANASGGGIAATGMAKVSVTGASWVVYNRATNFTGGGVFGLGQANISLGPGTLIAGNVATGKSWVGLALGGGRAVADSAHAALLGVDVINNSAPGAGGLAAAGNAAVFIVSSRVKRNNATENAGGGLAVAMNATVTVGAGSIIAENTALGGGGAYLQQDGALMLTGGSVVMRNEARVSPYGVSNMGGGIYATENSSVNIGGGVQFLDNRVTLRTGQDITVVDRVRLHLDDSVVGDAGPLTICSATVYVSTYICGVGQHLSKNYCACCPAHTYSHADRHRNTQCEKCPEFAFCPGADKVLPLAGYWHSSPQSTQIHQCPLQTVACGEHGVCQKGYQGNLCGACAAGFGMRQPLRCGQCMSPQRQLAIYLTLSCLTILFITLTVHLTWRDNQQLGAHVRASEMIKVLVLYLQYMVIVGSISAPFPGALKAVFEAASVVFGAASGQVMSLDCVVTHYVRAATLPLAIQRQLVNFIAPVLVFCSAMLLLWALSGFGLLLRRLRLRIRVRRGLVVLQSSGRRFNVFRHWPMVAIIVVFYAYPTLVKASMSAFACLPIDDASGPTAQYATRNHSAGYWVYDGLDKECFSGWHKVWALGVGLPAVLVFCVLLPVSLFFFLWFSSNRVSHTAFREQYGFLYRNYADDRVWWEPVWMAQTVLLCAVSVFHFSIQAYYSVLLLGGLFVGSAILQAVAKPYAERKLHLLQLAAMACLYSTAYCSLALFTVYGYNASSAAAPMAISGLIIAFNCGFILWSVYAIASAAAGKPVGLVAVQKVAAICYAQTPYLKGCGCAQAVVHLPSSNAQLSC